MGVDEPKMFCLGCGYPLDGLPGGRCPECGRAFDPSDLDTFKQDAGSLTPIYTARDQTEAELLRSRLRSEGIEVTVMGGSLAYGAGLGPAIAASRLQLWVGRQHAEQAAGIVAELLRGGGDAGGPAGGGDATWICPGCGEAIEAQFTSCWSCSAARPAPDPGDG